jgi:hypothetical protein
MANIEHNAVASDFPGKDVQGDFAQFTDFMRRLVSVPRSVVQERLAAEKLSKASVSRVPAVGKSRP